MGSKYRIEDIQDAQDYIEDLEDNIDDLERELDIAKTLLKEANRYVKYMSGKFPELKYRIDDFLDD